MKPETSTKKTILATTLVFTMIGSMLSACSPKALTIQNSEQEVVPQSEVFTSPVFICGNNMQSEIAMVQVDSLGGLIAQWFEGGNALRDASGRLLPDPEKNLVNPVIPGGRDLHILPPNIAGDDLVDFNVGKDYVIYLAEQDALNSFIDELPEDVIPQAPLGGNI